TYQWLTSYNDKFGNNGPLTDANDPAEQVTVVAATPAISTVATPAAATLATTAPTLSDSAVLSGGYFPTGSIVFTLTGPGGFSYTQTDTVSGAGTYSASTMLPTMGAVAGTYTWTAHYSGDANNKSADDQGGIAEQTVVSPASSTIVTTASPS